MKVFVFILLFFAFLNAQEKGYDFELYNMKDSLYSIKSIRTQAETKIIAIDFFSIYCEPCKKALPEWAALYKDYNKKGLQVLLVILPGEGDRDEELANIETFLKGTSLPFTVLFDKYKLVGKQYGVIDSQGSAKVPQAFLIDKNAKLVLQSAGHKEMFEKIKSILQ